METQRWLLQSLTGLKYRKGRFIEWSEGSVCDIKMCDDELVVKEGLIT